MLHSKEARDLSKQQEHTEDESHDAGESPALRRGLSGSELAGRPGDFEGFLFWRASLRWQRMMTAVLRPFELTHVQWALLMGAWMMEIDEGRPPSQRELAEHAATDVMMTSQVLATLEKRGLVVRRQDPADKRIRRVSATAEGVDLADRALAVVAPADVAFFSQIGPPGSLIEPLRKLADWEA